MARSFLTSATLSSEDLFLILERAKTIKAAIRQHNTIDLLKNRVVGMLFEKPSTRTRTSFEAAILRLGGRAIYLSSSDLQLKRGEPVKDTGRMLGGYLDGLIARVYAHQGLEELSHYSGIPVINALSDLEHPTQAVCDLFTISEAKGEIRGLTLAYIGDGNNVCHSLLLTCALAGVDMRAACPGGYHPRPDIFDNASEIAKKSGARLHLLEDPREAAAGADVLYTDVWVSMGEEDEEEEKLEAFEGYQINADLLRIAARDALVMHCLPAHRGLEITDEVIEGPQSVVWQQGHNKMHGAAAIMDFFLL